MDLPYPKYERGNMAYVKPDQKKADARKLGFTGL